MKLTVNSQAWAKMSGGHFGSTFHTYFLQPQAKCKCQLCTFCVHIENRILSYYVKRLSSHRLKSANSWNAVNPNLVLPAKSIAFYRFTDLLTICDWILVHPPQAHLSAKLMSLPLLRSGIRRAIALSDSQSLMGCWSILFSALQFIIKSLSFLCARTQACNIWLDCFMCLLHVCFTNSGFLVGFGNATSKLHWS